MEEGMQRIIKTKALTTGNGKFTDSLADVSLFDLFR